MTKTVEVQRFVCTKIEDTRGFCSIIQYCFTLLRTRVNFVPLLYHHNLGGVNACRMRFCYEFAARSRVSVAGNGGSGYDVILHA